MLNMISLEKHQDTDWPSGKFTNIYKLTKERFAPDDDVAEMDMEDDLRKIKCARTRDPKKILDNIVAIKVQYGCVFVRKQEDSHSGASRTSQLCTSDNDYLNSSPSSQ